MVPGRSQFLGRMLRRLILLFCLGRCARRHRLRLWSAQIGHELLCLGIDHLTLHFLERLVCRDEVVIGAHLEGNLVLVIILADSSGAIGRGFCRSRIAVAVQKDV